MVFGNMGDTSATGVAFTRDPSTGESKLLRRVPGQCPGRGRGRRHPHPAGHHRGRAHRVRLRQAGFDGSRDARGVQGARRASTTLLEKHYRDMQDIEFTVERGKLWMLQTRSGKRTAKAALRIAVELANEGLISENDARAARRSGLARPAAASDHRPRRQARRGRDRPAGLAGRSHRARSCSPRTRRPSCRPMAARSSWCASKPAPEDIHGMHAAEGILTTRGGMTSPCSGGRARHGQALRLGLRHHAASTTAGAR